MRVSLPNSKGPTRHCSLFCGGWKDQMQQLILLLKKSIWTCLKARDLLRYKAPKFLLVLCPTLQYTNILPTSLESLLLLVHSFKSM